MKCEDCRWWVRFEPNENTVCFEDELSCSFGHCHINPPLNKRWKWPQTLPNDFCGRFSPNQSSDARLDQ